MGLSVRLGVVEVPGCGHADVQVGPEEDVMAVVGINRLFYRSHVHQRQAAAGGPCRRRCILEDTVMKNILRRSLFLTLLVSVAVAAQAPMAPGTTYDVRNGDQQGKLMIGDADLSFESLTDAKHSKTWAYADIRSLEKKRKQLMVRPFKGSRYDFQLSSNQMRDQLYDAITAKILAARAQGKKK